MAGKGVTLISPSGRDVSPRSLVREGVRSSPRRGNGRAPSPTAGGLPGLLRGSPELNSIVQLGHGLGCSYVEMRDNLRSTHPLETVLSTQAGEEGQGVYACT